jgi:hypothetical protein
MGKLLVPGVYTPLNIEKATIKMPARWASRISAFHKNGRAFTSAGIDQRPGRREHYEADVHLWLCGQTVEFGGLTVINMGPGVSKESLPHPKLNLDYKGRDSKAAWRKAAAERIEKHRKGDLRVLVVDASGKPLPNATVKVDMTRHAFYFGSSFPGSMLPAEYQDIKPWNADFQRTAGASPEDKKKIQETFLRLFNATTSAPTWSTWGGADARISQSDVMGIMRWFAEHDIPNFNLQAVYPSPEFTAPAAHKEFFETKKKAEFAQALKEYVTLPPPSSPASRASRSPTKLRAARNIPTCWGANRCPIGSSGSSKPTPKCRRRLMALTAWTGARCKRRIAALNGPAKILKAAVLLRLDLVAAQTRRADRLHRLSESQRHRRRWAGSLF